MRVSKPIFWHQGMFMQPQHFQYSEVYWQSLLGPMQQMMQPHFWGVIDLNLSRSALPNRSCELVSGRFIFPDGSQVSVPDNGQLPKRSFDENAVEPDRPFTIYIGVRSLQQGEPNVTVVNSSGDVQSVKTRYFTRVDPRSAQDLYQDGPDASIQELDYKLEFLFEHEIALRSEFQVIPVAQVVRDGDQLRYTSDYIPPLVQLGGNASLLSMIREIRDEITGRAIQLDYSDASSSGISEFDPNVLRYRIGLQALSQYVPRLVHLCEQDTIHPWQIYGVLRELIGELSTFSGLVNMVGEKSDGERMVPVYDHTNLTHCFQAVRALVTALLNEISIGPRYLVDMAFEEDVYHADVPEHFFEEQVDYYLVLNTQALADDWRETFETTAKLASFDTVKQLAQRSLPGVPMTLLGSAPIGLPRKAFANYIRLDANNEQWDKVRRQKNAALHWAEAPDDLKCELVILRK
ncbi:MAG TPA: type VI secretion system baseplate subunit TssK [Saccharospirillum sp.]|nr:type VI secretion system baseplate subunit TssK [Saccharospirillum sp.]